MFVELPKVGRSLKKAEAAAVVESVKAASDVYAPISGEVLEVNDALAAEPALVNSDAAGKAWFFKMKIADKSELGGLMDEAAYAHTAENELAHSCHAAEAGIDAAFDQDVTTGCPP